MSAACCRDLNIFLAAVCLLRWSGNTETELFQADAVGERPRVFPSIAVNVTVIKATGWGRDDPVFAEPYCSLLNWTPSPVS